ncbi:MAG: rod shape-determining protein MreC [Candidatus Acidiferrales bacterium]|jgi:rod shape-determining protein MreC
MLDTNLRQRPLALLVGVVLVQLLLLAFQIKREHDVPLIRLWAAEIVTPVGRAGTWTSSKIRGVWTGYVALHGAHRENVDLRSELDQLRLRNRELETDVAEAQRLRVLLNFSEAHPEAPMLAAQVIGASADSASHTLFVNRGERDGVRRNMAVITPDGIVGKIVEVFSNDISQVLLINDKDSGVGALFVDTRTHGVVKGAGDPQPFMDYIVNDEKVHPGELIVTSGEDRIFPKGLPVGVVASAASGNPFQLIHVQSAVRLDRLEDVLILLSRQDLALKPVDDSADAPPSEPAGQLGGAPSSAQTAAQPAAQSLAPGASKQSANAPRPAPASPARTAPSAPPASEQ